MSFQPSISPSTVSIVSPCSSTSVKRSLFRTGSPLAPSIVQPEYLSPTGGRSEASSIKYCNSSLVRVISSTGKRFSISCVVAKGRCGLKIPQAKKNGLSGGISKVVVSLITCPFSNRRAMKSAAWLSFCLSTVVVRSPLIPHFKLAGL